MEWGAVGAALVGIIIGAFQAVKFFSGESKKQREEDEKQRKVAQRQLRKSFRWGDLAMDHFARLRMQRHQHNADYHPKGDGAIPVEDLPDVLNDGIRDYVEDET